MEIRPTRGYRIFLFIGGLAFAALWSGLAIAGNAGRAGLITYILLAVFIAMGLGISLAGVLPSYLRADESTVTLHPPIGRTKSFPRASLSRITRSGGGRAGPVLEFKSNNGKRLFRTQLGFSRQDVEGLARYLGVPCYWEFGADSTLGDLKPGASWDEVKAHLDPDLVAEAEKHMKKP